jgi:hypothetical protein
MNLALRSDVAVDKECRRAFATSLETGLAKLALEIEMV